MIVAVLNMAVMGKSYPVIALCFIPVYVLADDILAEVSTDQLL